MSYLEEDLRGFHQGDDGDANDNMIPGMFPTGRRRKSGYVISPYYEKEALNKSLPQEIDNLLKKYIGTTLIEFRKRKEEINQFVRSFLEREMAKCENAHTAEWSVRIETIQTAPNLFVVSDISACLKFT